MWKRAIRNTGRHIRLRPVVSPSTLRFFSEVQEGADEDDIDVEYSGIQKTKETTPQTKALLNVSNSETVLDLFFYMRTTIENFRSLAPLETQTLLRALNKTVYGDLGISDRFMEKFDVDAFYTQINDGKEADDLRSTVMDQRFVHALLSGDRNAAATVGVDFDEDLAIQAKQSTSVEDDLEEYNLAKLKENEERRQNARKKLMTLFGDTQKAFNDSLMFMDVSSVSAEELRNLVYCIKDGYDHGLADVLPLEHLANKAIDLLNRRKIYFSVNILADLTDKLLSCGYGELDEFKPLLKFIVENIEDVEPKFLANILLSLKKSKRVLPQFNAEVVGYVRAFSGKMTGEQLGELTNITISSDPNLGPRHQKMMEIVSMEILQNPDKFSMKSLIDTINGFAQLNYLPDGILSLLDTRISDEFKVLFTPGSYKMRAADVYSESQKVEWDRQDPPLTDKEFLIDYSKMKNYSSFDIVSQIAAAQELVDPYFHQFIKPGAVASEAPQRTTIIPADKLPYTLESDIPEFEQIRINENVTSVVNRNYWIKRIQTNKAKKITQEIKFGHQQDFLASLLPVLERLQPFHNEKYIQNIFANALPYFARNVRVLPFDVVNRAGHIFRNIGTPSNHALFHLLELRASEEFAFETSHEIYHEQDEFSPEQYERVLKEFLSKDGPKDEKSLEEYLATNVPEYADSQKFMTGSMDFDTLQGRSDHWHYEALTSTEKDSLQRQASMLFLMMNAGTPFSAELGDVMIKQLFRYKNHLSPHSMIYLVSSVFKMIAMKQNITDEEDMMIPIASDLCKHLHRGMIDFTDYSTQDIATMCQFMLASSDLLDISPEIDQFIHQTLLPEITARLHGRFFDRVTNKSGDSLASLIASIGNAMYDENTGSIDQQMSDLHNGLLSKSMEHIHTMTAKNLVSLCRSLAKACVTSSFSSFSVASAREVFKIGSQRFPSFGSRDALNFCVTLGESETITGRTLLPRWQQERVYEIIGHKINEFATSEVFSVFLQSASSKIKSDVIIQKTRSLLSDSQLSSMGVSELGKLLGACLTVGGFHHEDLVKLTKAFRAALASNEFILSGTEVSRTMMSIGALCLGHSHPQFQQEARQCFQECLDVLDKCSADDTNEMCFNALFGYKCLKTVGIASEDSFIQEIEQSFEISGSSDPVHDSLFDVVSSVVDEHIEKSFISSDSPVPIPVALPNQKVSIGIAYPSMYLGGDGSGQLQGMYASQRALLKSNGWKLVVVPFDDWQSMGSDETMKAQYIADILKQVE